MIILYFYTRFTARQLKVNQEALKATREALEEARENNKAALAESERSYALNREALILSRRAWLNAELYGNPLSFQPIERWVFVRIENVGMIPVNDIQIGCMAFLADSTSLANLPSYFGLAPATPLGVRAVADYSVDTAFLGGNPGNSLITAGPSPQILHVVCRVRYNDGFGGERSIVLGWHLVEGPPGIPPRWVFTHGIHHLE